MTALRTILVIDDDEQIRYLLFELFRYLGFVVVCMPDVPSALRALRQTRPDLVILDIRMPGVDGTAFLKLVDRYLPAVFRPRRVLF